MLSNDHLVIIHAICNGMLVFWLFNSCHYDGVQKANSVDKTFSNAYFYQCETNSGDRWKILLEILARSLYNRKRFRLSWKCSYISHAWSHCHASYFEWAQRRSCFSDSGKTSLELITIHYSGTGSAESVLVVDPCAWRQVEKGIKEVDMNAMIFGTPLCLLDLAVP